jgi:hypothetical protein
VREERTDNYLEIDRDGSSQGSSYKAESNNLRTPNEEPVEEEVDGSLIRCGGKENQLEIGTVRIMRGTRDSEDDVSGDVHLALSLEVFLQDAEKEKQRCEIKISSVLDRYGSFAADAKDESLPVQTVTRQTEREVLEVQSSLGRDFRLCRRKPSQDGFKVRSGSYREKKRKERHANPV